MEQYCRKDCSLFADEMNKSQLAVVQGLVMDRVQAVNFKSPVFQERCCRLSYGIRCRELHDPVNISHLGKAVTIDPRDKKRYVENQIDWFIKQVGVPMKSSKLSF